MINIKKSDSGVYWAEFDDGEVLSEDSQYLDSVFQDAADIGGEINFDDGKTNSGLYYDFSSGFTGIKVKSVSQIRGSKKVYLQVPSGYTGDVVILDVSYQSPLIQVTAFEWEGITMRESGTHEYNWTGFHYLSNVDEGGVVYAKIKNCDVQYSKRGVLLESTDPGAWINACIFEDFHISGSRIGYEFKKDAVGGIPFNAINRINWTRCFHQSSSLTAYGYKGVDGEGHVFDDSRVYDIHLSAVSGKKISQFLATANKILILGGIMTGSSPPQYMDWQCPEGNITVLDPFEKIILGGGEVKEVRAKKYTPFVADRGIYTKPGGNDGKTATFTIPHGQASTPTVYNVVGVTPDANVGPFDKSVDATNITIKYIDRLPPPSTPGLTNNLKWYWEVLA